MIRPKSKSCYVDYLVAQISFRPFLCFCFDGSWCVEALQAAVPVGTVVASPGWLPEVLLGLRGVQASARHAFCGLFLINVPPFLLLLRTLLGPRPGGP